MMAGTVRGATASPDGTSIETPLEPIPVSSRVHPEIPAADRRHGASRVGVRSMVGTGSAGPPSLVHSSARLLRRAVPSANSRRGVVAEFRRRAREWDAMAASAADGTVVAIRKRRTPDHGLSVRCLRAGRGPDASRSRRLPCHAARPDGEPSSARIGMPPPRRHPGCAGSVRQRETRARTHDSSVASAEAHATTRLLNPNLDAPRCAHGRGEGGRGGCGRGAASALQANLQCPRQSGMHGRFRTTDRPRDGR